MKKIHFIVFISSLLFSGLSYPVDSVNIEADIQPIFLIM